MFNSCAVVAGTNNVFPTKVTSTCLGLARNQTRKEGKMRDDNLGCWHIIIRPNHYDWFAKGLSVGVKEKGLITRDIKYKNGTIYHKNEIATEYKIDDLNLEWNATTQEYRPTLKDKLLKLLFRKDYPNTVQVRPNDNSIVLVKYDGIDYYEIAEYDKNSWTTEYFSPVMPSHFAYIPNIIEMTERCHDQHKKNNQ